MTESINFDTAREIALIGIRLLDDAHTAWVAAQHEADHALQAWSEGGQHRTAYEAYRAAVDREEAAARDLERLHELIRVCVDAFVATE